MGCQCWHGVSETLHHQRLLSNNSQKGSKSFFMYEWSLMCVDSWEGSHWEKVIILSNLEKEGWAKVLSQEILCWDIGKESWNKSLWGVRNTMFDKMSQNLQLPTSGHFGQTNIGLFLWVAVCEGGGRHLPYQRERFMDIIVCMWSACHRKQGHSVHYSFNK